MPADSALPPPKKIVKKELFCVHLNGDLLFSEVPGEGGNGSSNHDDVGHHEVVSEIEDVQLSIFCTFCKRIFSLK